MTELHWEDRIKGCMHPSLLRSISLLIRFCSLQQSTHLVKKLQHTLLLFRGKKNWRQKNVLSNLWPCVARPCFLTRSYLPPGNFLCPLPIPDLSQKLHHPIKPKTTTKNYFVVFFFFFFSPEQPSMRTLQKHRQRRKREQTHPLATRSLSSKLLTSLVSRQMVQNLELSLQWGLAQAASLGPRVMALG